MLLSVGLGLGTSLKSATEVCLLPGVVGHGFRGKKFIRVGPVVPGSIRDLCLSLLLVSVKFQSSH